MYFIMNNLVRYNYNGNVNKVTYDSENVMMLVKRILTLTTYSRNSLL